MSNYNNDRYYDYGDERSRPPPPLAPSPVCMGCQFNKMPYCFAPNSNDRRIDLLPGNFMCAVKEVEKKVDTVKQIDTVNKIDKKLDLINKKLNTVLKKMKKWD